MKIILDFDRTLFATERLYAALEAIKKPHTAGTMESLQLLPIENYLYEDVAPFLRQFQKADLYILTSTSGLGGEWETDYQTEKIAASGLTDKVADVVVMRGTKGIVAASIAEQFPPHEPIIFVDDRIEQCISVQGALAQATCCLMVRDKSHIGDVVTMRGIRVVHTLADVNAIIETL